MRNMQLDASKHRIPTASNSFQFDTKKWEREQRTLVLRARLLVKAVYGRPSDRNYHIHLTRIRGPPITLWPDIFSSLFFWSPCFTCSRPVPCPKMRSSSNLSNLSKRLRTI